MHWLAFIGLGCLLVFTARFLIKAAKEGKDWYYLAKKAAPKSINVLKTLNLKPYHNVIRTKTALND